MATVDYQTNGPYRDYGSAQGYQTPADYPDAPGDFQDYEGYQDYQAPADYPAPEAYPAEPAPAPPQSRKARSSVNSRMKESLVFSAGSIRKQSLALFFLRLPALIPWIFIMRGWLSLNQGKSLTNVEADILGTGGELCFLIAVSITPIITLTGQQWIAPLRRWYGIIFALIGVSDGTTAAITTTFNGGVFGRLAGHSFLITGLLIVLLAVPILATANTPAQRKMGKYWKALQKVTYLLWGMIVLHLLLLDGFRPFGAAQGDGNPVFHQRFYQIMAVSIPLVLLRLPPVRRWVANKKAAHQTWHIYAILSPLLLLAILGVAFMINEEFFTGIKVMTMTNLPNN